MELYLMGGIAALIGVLWMRNKYLANKAKAQEARADRAEIIADHSEKVAKVERERNEGKADRIEEAVDDATQDEFSDFYDDDNT